MVPKLHKKGRSFRGAAAYLLHDKGGTDSSDRVAWVETRNLASDDPDVAWRVMAATAMDQERLKAEAGVRSTGRKSSDHVLHLTLSWHPDEADGLSRDEMRRAAFGAVRALGAEDRQAMLICHSDEEHPHLHVLLNRVSPEDGRMLSSSKEKLNLSRWAQGYEQERGQVFCEERVLNNAARDRGEFTRGGKDRPRHIFETEARAQAAANDNKSRAEQLREEERRKDAALSRKGRKMHARHAKDWKALTQDHRGRIAALKEALSRAQGQAKADTRTAYHPEWREQFRRHQSERDAFEEREAKLLGRMKNIIDTLKLAQRVQDADRQRSMISRAFDVISSSGGRKRALEASQRAEDRDLQKRQAQALHDKQEILRSEHHKKLEENRQRLFAERNHLQLRQRADQAQLRAQWKIRTADRRAVWERFRAEHLHRPAPQRDKDQQRADQKERKRKLERPAEKAAREKEQAERQREARRKAMKNRLRQEFERRRDDGPGRGGRDR